jgi:hypothetical protein
VSEHNDGKVRLLKEEPQWLLAQINKLSSDSRDPLLRAVL